MKKWNASKLGVQIREAPKRQSIAKDGILQQNPMWILHWGYVKLKWKFSCERNDQGRSDKEREDKQTMLDIKSEQKWPLVVQRCGQGSFLFAFEMVRFSTHTVGEDIILPQE